MTVFFEEHDLDIILKPDQITEFKQTKEQNVEKTKEKTFSHPQQGRIDLNTVNPFLPVLHQNSRCIGKSIPFRPQNFPRPSGSGLCPWDISRVLVNLLGVVDGFPNTSLVLVEHEYIIGTFGEKNQIICVLSLPCLFWS